ncbi:MAG TPA: DUF1269 domain-containing protein [Ktedonobacteraceae bacterium]
MGKEDPVYVWMGSYANVEDAEFDYKAVEQLHSSEKLGSYDYALVERDAEGNVHVHKHEKPTQHGTWWGIAAGAAVGLLFPPALIPLAAAGGLSGGFLSHLARGFSRKDMHELGETLDSGTAALVVIGRQRMMDDIASATTHAQKTIERPLNITKQEFEQEVEKANKEAAATSAS